MLIRTKERAVKYWRSLLGGENEKKKKTDNAYQTWRTD
jgi:hypothetical protein